MLESPDFFSSVYNDIILITWYQKYSELIQHEKLLWFQAKNFCILDWWWFAPDVKDCRMRDCSWRLSAQYKMFATKGQIFSSSASYVQCTMSSHVYGHLHSPWECCLNSHMFPLAFIKATITCTICKNYIFIEKGPKRERRKGGKRHCSHNFAVGAESHPVGEELVGIKHQFAST